MYLNSYNVRRRLSQIKLFFFLRVILHVGCKIVPQKYNIFLFDLHFVLKDFRA